MEKRLLSFLFLLITIIASAQTNTLPVIRLAGQFSNDYQAGTVSLYLPDGTSQELMEATIKWRGGTTNTENTHKRNYTIKFSEDKQFFGLRKDNKWLLDAGNADVFRLRNKIATDLWNDMAHKPYYATQEPKALSGVRGQVVEVYLNDEYMGIYSFTECMDRKQLKLKKYNKETGEIRGGLWKAVGWGNAMMWDCEPYDNHSETWGEFEVKYPELDDVPETDYSTLYNAIDFVAHSSDADFISHVGDYFDMPVVIDYYIFLYVLNAFDNRGKNMYWAVYDKTQDKKLTIAVWDLDGSAGQRWIDQWIPDSSSPDYPFTDNINLYYRLRQLNADAFNEKVLARYQQLRATCLSTDSLIKRYQDYDELLKNTGAAQREEERWSGDSDVRGEEISFQKETAYITDWITRHMQYLDDNVFTTTTNISYPSVSRHHTGFYNLNGQRINTPQKGIYIWKGKKIKR